MRDDIQDLFLLEPGTCYLNHGAFGACPRSVFDTWQGHQRRMEANPTRYFQRTLHDELNQARAAMAAFVNARPEDTVLVPNATYASNVMANSLGLTSGDAILTCSQEYGACLHVLERQAELHGFDVQSADIWMPQASHAEWAEAFLSHATTQTKAIFLSHITSSTARVLPVAAVCKLARERGIITYIDGAQSMGQVPVDVAAIGADAYLGNVHKWLFAPKTAAFLHVRPEHQASIQPVVTGWGWGKNRKRWYESTFQDLHAWLGTLDYAAWLSVPDAINFYETHATRETCHKLAGHALTQWIEASGCTSDVEPGSGQHAQMVCLPLPELEDTAAFHRRLNEEFRIEAPITRFRGQTALRLSIQCYNDEADIEQAIGALKTMLAP